ncbi:hypothetical protein [Pseudoxanthomonas composti]|uniref:CopG family transcriptional regulator n=1 Tax=Pseudoxanthomonas composti TaxID=2137479 RepID=A0A4Q1JR84_9GAMM|nr:hypothetical protein [Pseudoxanthomonas composti]RXR00294.1 hypothetical protein EPA99_16915 [Pseudoxanthomonas composti]
MTSVAQTLDPLLKDRIARIAEARGWAMEETLTAVIEQGLFVLESQVRGGLESGEVHALSEAIAALRQLPQGQGF